MRGISKSNFFTLENAMREELLNKFGVRSWEKEYVFREIADDSWWRSDREGFHYVPKLHEDACVQHIVHSFESDAKTLADAVFSARRQHARVVDACLIFLNMHADALETLCLYQRWPSNVIDLATQEEVLAAANAFLNGLVVVDDSFHLEAAQVQQHLHIEFSAWASDFILQLISWKAPDPNGQVVGDVPLPPPASGSENAGIPTP